ncbi:hypothetical protein LPB41_34470 [Thalassospira sp. MA62]|nr:hypothetical protein [Thalassospira sp. MA62]
MRKAMIGTEVRFVLVGLEVQKGVLESYDEHIFKVDGVVYPVQNIVAMNQIEHDEFVKMRHQNELIRKMKIREENEVRKMRAMA